MSRIPRRTSGSPPVKRIFWTPSFTAARASRRIPLRRGRPHGDPFPRRPPAYSIGIGNCKGPLPTAADNQLSGHIDRSSHYFLSSQAAARNFSGRVRRGHTARSNVRSPSFLRLTFIIADISSKYKPLFRAGEGRRGMKSGPAWKIVSREGNARCGVKNSGCSQR